MPRFVRFGAGAVSDMKEHLALVGHGEVCLVTDRGVRDAGLVDPVSRLIADCGFGYDIVDTVETQPSVTNVQGLLDRLRVRASVAVVAVGGGSVVDAAKIAALMATNEGSVSDVVQWFGRGFGAERSLQPGIPLFTVPTMVSGADMVPAAAITDPAAGTKFACWSLRLMPTATFADPAYTASAPRDVLVDAALDAFTHALEGLTSQTTTPVSQSLALDAAARIFRALPALELAPHDAAAREELCVGCLEAALVVGNTRAAAIHGLSYPVSSAFPISHGRANALLAPAVVRFNGPAVKREYFALAQALGVTHPGGPAEAIAAEIERINRRLGLPETLGAVGMRLESIPDLIVAAERNRWFFDEVNPRPVSRADMAELYSQALTGNP